MDDELNFTRTKLKIGEYDGVDIMRAWRAIDELLKARDRIEALEAENARLTADAKRLDWLEGEFKREGDWLAGDRSEPMPLSLFRANVPITRAAIDAALKDHP